ncbi:hypothetical protein J5991_01800 [Methanocorpusculum sp.]|nr:hypothetical protein [Methanocorpusculum sp.]
MTSLRSPKHQEDKLTQTHTEKRTAEISEVEGRRKTAVSILSVVHR